MTQTGALPNCKNTFLETDGYCTSCGQNHFKLQAKRQTVATYNYNPVYRPTPTPAPTLVQKPTYTPAPVYQPAQKPALKPSNKTTVAQKAALEAIDRLSELYPGVEVEAVFSTRRKNSSAYYHNKKEIRFGVAAVNWFYENGYKSGFAACTKLAAQILGRTATGTDAVKIHAAHEFAHAIVAQLDHNRFESHGPNFYRRFAEVIAVVL